MISAELVAAPAPSSVAAALGNLGLSLDDLELALGLSIPSANTLRAKYVHPVPGMDDGRVVVPTSGFRTSSRPGHDGVDLLFALWPSDGRQAEPNTDGKGKWWHPSNWPAVAIADGVVGKSEDISTGGYIRLDHADGVSSQYLHLSQRFLKVGDRVRRGQMIGFIGAGDSHLIHLHFQVRVGGVLVDPEPLLAYMPAIRNPLLPQGNTWIWALAGLALAGGALAYYLHSRRPRRRVTIMPWHLFEAGGRSAPGTTVLRS